MNYKIKQFFYSLIHSAVKKRSQHAYRDYLIGFILIKTTRTHIVLYLFAFLVPSLVLGANTEENFLLIERSEQTDLDLRVTSIGVFGLSNKGVGHINLSYIESDGDGNTLALDLGGGVTYRAGLTYFFSVGFLLGYNRDKSDYIGAYYPEIGIIGQITKTFAVIASGRKYSDLYSSIGDENIVMFGLLFGSQQ